MKNWNAFDSLIAAAAVFMIILICYGLYTDTPDTAGYVPNEKAIRL